MVVTHTALCCVVVPLSQLAISKAQALRSALECRPVRLCHRPYDCVAKDCHAVHAVSKTAYDTWQFRPVHANFVYATLLDAIYPMCQSLGSVDVLCPNDSNTVLDAGVPLCHLLLTLGATALAAGGRIPHCRHFYFRRACSLAHDCKFAHVVSVDGRRSSAAKLGFAGKKVVPSAADRGEARGGSGRATGRRVPPPPPPSPNLGPRLGTSRRHRRARREPTLAPLEPTPPPPPSRVVRERRYSPYEKSFIHETLIVIS
jgi:hypothetical protein